MTALLTGRWSGGTFVCTIGRQLYDASCFCLKSSVHGILVTFFFNIRTYIYIYIYIIYIYICPNIKEKSDQYNNINI